jgi:hypothetical protein
MINSYYFNLKRKCSHDYPDEITQAIARAACVTKATELLRPMLPFPDLLDQENALRKSLAEPVQTRKLSCSNEISKSPNFIRKCWRKTGGRTEQFAGKPLTGSKRPGRGYAVAAVKSRWLRHVGREQGELLLIDALG